MFSGGKTQTVKPTALNVGRHVLCDEKASTRGTSPCAKLVKKTTSQAQAGLNAKQKKLWKTFVFDPAVQLVERYCDKKAGPVGLENDWGGRSGQTQKQRDAKFKVCTAKVMRGVWKFDGLNKQKHKWIDYIKGGAKKVKTLTTPDAVVIPGAAEEVDVD